MRKTVILILTVLLPLSVTAQERPNILLIVADDMGYTDVGAYGGEISTPNIDALAGEGILFTQFHTAPVCAVTRAMLLSGNNNHVAGMGNQYGFYEAHYDLPGYEGHLSERIVPLPRLLNNAGYHTYSAGKWHLGTSREHSPRAAGFERHYNMTQGAAAHYGMTGFHEGGSLYREDGEETQFPDGAYAPEYYTDRLIEFIDSNRDDGRPFFVYAAYTSPHWPLQVPDSYLDLYDGRYDEGYDVLREQRFEAAKRAGVISADHELPPRNPALVSWDELSADEKRVEAREMELYASLLHNFDDHIGRLIDYLKDADLYDNTLIVFMSDNGAAADDFYARGSYSEYLQAHYDNSYENMGKPSSFVSYGLGWAEAGSAPFSRHKGHTRQGGIASSMIIAGRNVDRSGVINDSYLTVMDLAPTFLELAGVEYPTGNGIRPILGESMVDLLAGNTHAAHAEDYSTVLYHKGRAFVRQGDWKLVNLNAPFNESTFELYNLAEDPGEAKNLRYSEPERFAAMVRLWHAERQELGILIPEGR